MEEQGRALASCTKCAPLVAFLLRTQPLNLDLESCGGWRCESRAEPGRYNRARGTRASRTEDLIPSDLSCEARVWQMEQSRVHPPAHLSYCCPNKHIPSCKSCGGDGNECTPQGVHYSSPTRYHPAREESSPDGEAIARNSDPYPAATEASTRLATDDAPHFS